MGRHSSGESPGMSVKLLIATPLCLILGAFAIWMGLVTIHEPATCDLKTMSASDVCRVGSKLVEELIVDGVSNPPEGKYRYLAQQEAYNRIAAPTSVLVGVVFTAGSVWLGVLQARGLRA
ncbi:hypothetical protein [Rhodococcus sp. APC 3903]|uniref:hypothetical protein n=1 Tax=Rhodococcus sp. APC 3903 TaxID=3035193 RepID=UPI0025B44CC9|nr:hypothetical protein [Rhodococcus sp. APC 3903]MDN3460963.1 hypothetical protein [Rhodococcus sp. APC 3903]